MVGMDGGLFFLEARARGIIGAPDAQERTVFANLSKSPFDNRPQVTELVALLTTYRFTKHRTYVVDANR